MRKFSKNAKIFLIMQTLFGLAAALSSTFVNVYMWKLTSDLRVIGLYNIVVFTFIPLTFVLSGYIARRKGITACIRLGIIAYIAFYVIILLMREGVKDYILLLGAFYGCGMGFYYFGNNTLIYHFTEAKNRGYYLGLSGALGGTMGTIAPIISGWLIISKSSLKGYYTVFLISFIIFIISIILSYFLSTKKIEGKFELSSVLFNRRNKLWNKILVANFLCGFRDGALAYIVNILIFMAFNNELKMGKFTTFTSILVIISTYMVGRIYKKELRDKLFFVGSTLCFTGTVVLVMWTNYVGVIINGILSSVFTSFWNIPFNTMTYEVAEKNTAHVKNMSDYMISKEIPTALGRISSIILYIIVSTKFMDTTAIKVILPFLSSMILINYLYLRKVKA